MIIVGIIEIIQIKVQAERPEKHEVPKENAGMAGMVEMAGMAQMVRMAGVPQVARVAGMEGMAEVE